MAGQMAVTSRIAPCLWFDNEAEEAARFYTSIFPNSKITRIARYGKEGFEIHKRPEGSVMTVEFDLDGTAFTALNGGPLFKFNEAISFQVFCDTQQEIDSYWEKLSHDKSAEQCGWLKDKFGLSWQIVPKVMDEWTAEMPTEKSERVMKAMMPMKKLDIAELTRAYEGQRAA